MAGGQTPAGSGDEPTAAEALVQPQPLAAGMGTSALSPCRDPAAPRFLSSPPLQAMVWGGAGRWARHAGVPQPVPK